MEERACGTSGQTLSFGERTAPGRAPMCFYHWKSTVKLGQIEPQLKRRHSPVSGTFVGEFLRFECWQAAFFAIGVALLIIEHDECIDGAMAVTELEAAGEAAARGATWTCCWESCMLGSGIHDLAECRRRIEYFTTGWRTQKRIDDIRQNLIERFFSDHRN